MPTLSPEMNFEVAAESPVSPVDLRGVTSLVGTIAKGVGESGEVDSNALDASLMRSLKKVRALHDAGRSNEAYALETKILSNYTAYGGDLGSTRIKTAVQGITGRDPDDFGNSPEEVALQETLDSEEFQAAWLGTFSTNPDASPEERRDLALGHLSVKQGREAILEQAQFNWTAEGEAAFMGTITDFENTLFGGLGVAAEQGGELTLEDTQLAVQQFNAFRRNLEARRPPNITNEQWSKIKARLDQTEEELKYFAEISAPDQVGARAVSDLQQAIRMAPNVSDVRKNVMLSMVQDPEILLQWGIIPQGEAIKILDSLQLPENGGLTPGELRNPAITDPYPEVDAADMEAGDVYNHMTGAMRGAGLARGLTTNEDMRDNWGKAVTIGLSRMNELAARGEWMTPEQYEAVFSDQFFEQLNSIKDIDPDLHAAITARAQRALTTTGMALQERYDSAAANSPFMVNTETGEAVVTEAGVRAVLPAGRNTDKLIKEVIRIYGGDADTALNLAFADNGRQLLTTGNRNIEAMWTMVQAKGERGRRQVELAAGGIYNVLNAQRRLAEMDPSKPVPGEKVNRAVPAGTNRIMRLMDRTEGAGRYDTLFNHANREGNEFSNIDVTEMTIDEVLEFANPQGKYGQWVKAELARMGLRPRVATPMGRYQFVGSTLRQVAREMGIPGNTLFDEQTQDAMFDYLARKLIAGKSPAEAREALRGTWEGFKREYVSDEELDAAIAEFRGSPSVQEIGAAITERGSTGSETSTERLSGAEAPFVSQRPRERPQDAPQAATEDTTNATPDDGEQGREASRKVTQEQKEMILALFPDRDFTDEEIQRFYEFVMASKEAEE